MSNDSTTEPFTLVSHEDGGSGTVQDAPETNGVPKKRAVVVNTTVIEPEPDSEGDDDDDDEEVEGKEGQYLEDFPDDTDVSLPLHNDSLPSLSPLTLSHSFPQTLELIHSQLSSLSSLGLTRFAAHLKKLCLRQNYIASLDPEIFHQLTELEDLDLYDNRLKTIGHALDKLTKLL